MKSVTPLIKGEGGPTAGGHRVPPLQLIGAVCAMLALSWSVFGQARPADLHAKLVLDGNKSTYRVGEPIKLIIEFTADGDGYQVDTIPDGWQPTTDVISVSPQAGVTHWLDEYMAGHRPARDVMSSQNLSRTPIRVEVMLNDTLRFDKPGKYSVQVETRRVSKFSLSDPDRPPFVLKTNPVKFEVQPMSEDDEKKEVKRLSQLLATARGWEAEAKLARELSYLAGDPGAREKVRRFLNSEEKSGNYLQHVTFGLYISRNRALVLQLLETAMRDPNRPVTWSLFSAITQLRMLRDSNGTHVVAHVTQGSLSPTVDPRLVQIQHTYIAELAAGLGKRVGNSQTTTAMTILMNLPKDTQSADPVLMEVRRLLIQQFDSLHPYSQEYLLRVQWERLRDPSLVPSLEKMLGYGGNSRKNIHDEALKRLMEIAPDKARQYVIAEIRDPISLVDYEILQSLSDSSLPEVDAPLVEQIRNLTSSKSDFNPVFLKHKVSLAARYASENVYPDLMQIYSTVGAKLPLDVRAGLLAYLAKHNESEALPLIEQTVSELEPGQDSNFLHDLVRLYYSEAIGSVLRKRLESDQPQAVSTAAYLISLYGPAEDQKVIEARLERWLKEWRHRPAEADASFQGMAERELITALGKAKSWELSSERVRELQQGCVTKICKENFRIR